VKEIGKPMKIAGTIRNSMTRPRISFALIPGGFWSC
jgi:hypothetical protein